MRARARSTLSSCGAASEVCVFVILLLSTGFEVGMKFAFYVLCCHFQLFHNHAAASDHSIVHALGALSVGQSTTIQSEPFSELTITLKLQLKLYSKESTLAYAFGPACFRKGNP